MKLDDWFKMVRLWGRGFMDNISRGWMVGKEMQINKKEITIMDTWGEGKRWSKGWDPGMGEGCRYMIECSISIFEKK